MLMLSKKIKNPYAIYSLLFLLIWAIAMLPFALRGNSLIGESDSFNQSFPVFVYVGQYIRELFKGNITQFDFRLGLGDDVVAALNWHGFGDIFQLISAFVKPENAEQMYEFVMMLKFYCCGIAFLYYSEKHVQNDNYRVSGALMYAFSVFSLFWGLNCWMFLNPMITLPFILRGIDQLLDNDIGLSLPLILALFIQALNGFYFLYIEIIIAVVYFLIISVVRFRFRELTSKQIVLKAIKIAEQGILGTAMGSVMLIPSIMGYLSSSRTDDVQIIDSPFHLFFFEHYEYYLQSLADLLIPDVYNSVITIPITVLLGMILIMTGNSIKREIKALTVFWTIAFWIPVMGNIMNGFSYWVDRWYFAVLLFLIVGTVSAIEKAKKINGLQIAAYAIIASISCTAHIFLSVKTMGLIVQIIVFAVEIVVMLIVLRRKNARIFLCFTTTIVILNCLFVFGPKVLGGSGYSAGFKEMNKSYEEISHSVEKVENADVSFQRWDIYDSSLSASLVMNYYGTTEYFSMLNSYVSEFFREMYISPGVRSATWILKGLDSRYELESLLSVSEYMEFELDENGHRNTVIKKNEDILPLGYAYGQYMQREEFDKLNAIEKNSALLNCVVLEDIHTNMNALTEVTAADIKKNSSDKEIEIVLEDSGIIYQNGNFLTNDGATIKVYLENVLETDDVEYYVKLTNFCLLDGGVWDIRIGNKDIQLRNEEDNYYVGPNDFWIHVSEFERDQNGTYFEINFSGEKTYILDKVQVYQHLVDRKAIYQRTVNTLQNMVIDTNSVAGHIAVDESDMIFFSIPYSRGWRAYVDGVEAEILRANIAFMAVPLEQGEHEIVLKYETPGLKVGMLISVIAIIIFIVIDRIKNFKKYKYR